MNTKFPVIRQPKLHLVDRPKSIDIRIDGKKFDFDDDFELMLGELLDAYLSGASLRVSSEDVHMTSEEAARFLGVSRPTAIRLFDRFGTPITKVGRHRRIRFADLLILQDQIRDSRENALQEMISISEAVRGYEERHSVAASSDS